VSRSRNDAFAVLVIVARIEHMHADPTLAVREKTICSAIVFLIDNQITAWQRVPRGVE
jgi:hypothetical protein